MILSHVCVCVYLEYFKVLRSTFKYSKYYKYIGQNLSISTSTMAKKEKNLSISTSTQEGVLKCT